MRSFHQALATLYDNTIERERVAKFGCDAQLRLLRLDASTRQLVEVQRLRTGGWNAWRITNNKDDADKELWFVEVSPHSGVDPDLLRSVSVIDLVTTTGAQRLKKLQSNNPLEAGQVWQIKCQPTGEAVTV